MKDVLVIGYGNTLRGDDGAGVRAAEAIALRSPDVKTLCVQHIGPALADMVAGHETVVFIDASVAVSHLKIHDIQPSLPVTQTFSHSCTPEELLGLAAFLYDAVPSRAIMCEIPAVQTAFGESLSPVTQRAVRECVDACVVLAGLVTDPADQMIE